MDSIGEILIMYGTATKDLENKYNLYASKIKSLKESRVKGKKNEDLEKKIEKYKLKATETQTKISNILYNINENLQLTLDLNNKKSKKTKEEPNKEEPKKEEIKKEAVKKGKVSDFIKTSLYETEKSETESSSESDSLSETKSESSFISSSSSESDSESTETSKSSSSSNSD